MVLPEERGGLSSIKTIALEPTFFGLGAYMVLIILAEPKDVKKFEKMIVDELAEMNLPPIYYYVQPFDFGRSIFFRIFCFPDPKDQDTIQKVRDKYEKLYASAMENYGAVPMRYKILFLPGSVGYQALAVVL